VDGNHEIILHRAGRRDDRQKLRGRNRAHPGKFSTPLSVGTSTNCSRFAACHAVAVRRWEGAKVDRAVPHGTP
jgi:hypothetical protein